MSAKLTAYTQSDGVAERTTEDVYDDGVLRVEHSNYYVTCGGRLLKLPRTEFLLLSRLVRSLARVVPSEELWRYVWGDSKQYNCLSLRVHIHRLRNKLAPFGVQIEPMVNVGYSLSLTRAQPSAGYQSERAPQPEAE